MENILDTVVVGVTGISGGDPIVAVLSGRENIIELTERSHDAALKPEQPGNFTHSERAALACRMARLNLDDELASHYESMVKVDDILIADLSFEGGNNIRLTAIIRHADLITRSPKDAAENDVTALMSAGITEEDIVRLSELIAFVNYQARVIAGLRLMVAVS